MRSLSYIDHIGADVFFLHVVLGVDEKRTPLMNFAVDAGSRLIKWTVEQMLVHVDTELGRSSPILADVRIAFAVVADAHEGADIGLNPTMRLT